MVIAEATLINQQYGRGLQALARLAGITNQTDLGELIGLKQASMSDIMSGKRGLKVPEIELIVQTFAELIPGYDEDECLRVLRGRQRPKLRLVDKAYMAWFNNRPVRPALMGLSGLGQVG